MDTFCTHIRTIVRVLIQLAFVDEFLRYENVKLVNFPPTSNLFTVKPFTAKPLAMSTTTATWFPAHQASLLQLTPAIVTVHTCAHMYVCLCIVCSHQYAMFS